MTNTLNGNQRLALMKQGIEKVSLEPQICPKCKNIMCTEEYIADQKILICWSYECLDDAYINLQILQNMGRVESVYPANFYFMVRERRLFDKAAIWNLAEDLVKMEFVWKKTKEKFSNTGLVIDGSVGVGKSYLMFAFIRDLMMAGETDIFYASEEQFFSDLKSTMDQKSEFTSKQIIGKLKNSKYLFYDDLGCAAKTLEGNWGRQILMEIVNHRYENQMMTVYASNIKSDMRGTILGDRIADRLNTFTWMTVEGNSKRKPQWYESNIISNSIQI